MYSCVPGQRAGEILVEPVGQDRLRLLGRAGVALDQVVERALRVEHQRVEVPGPVARHLRGRVGQRLHAQRVGQASGRVHGDDAGASAGPGGRQRERRRHGRLAHAARSAAHDDGAFLHQVRQRRCGAGADSAAAGPWVRPSRPSSSCGALRHQAGHRVRQRVGKHPRLGRARWTAASSAGTSRWGRGRSRLRRSICSVETAWRARRKRRASSSAARWSGSTVTPAVAATSDAGRSRPTGSGSQALTMTGPELDAGLVLEGVGGLDRLRDRQLLGQRDQDHPAAGRVAQEVDHVLGLGPQGPAPGRADQPAGRGEERDGVARWPVRRPRSGRRAPPARAA